MISECVCFFSSFPSFFLAVFQSVLFYRLLQTRAAVRLFLRELPETLMLWLRCRITVAVGQQPSVSLKKNYQEAKERPRAFLQVLCVFVCVCVTTRGRVSGKHKNVSYRLRSGEALMGPKWEASCPAPVNTPFRLPRTQNQTDTNMLKVQLTS